MEIKLRDEFIKLGQALKAAGLVESGVDAKFAGRACEGQWRGGDAARQEALRRGQSRV